MAGHGDNKKDDYCVPGEEIARGLIFLAPGSPPPSCPCVSLLCVLRSPWSATRFGCFASSTEIYNKNGATARFPSVLSYSNYRTCVEGLQNCSLYGYPLVLQSRIVAVLMELILDRGYAGGYADGWLC